MVLKIKLEDKAAFLNSMEKQGQAIDTQEIKNNKLEGYFEVTINNPEQEKIAKDILKQSPKINTIKEIKRGLTKSKLKEMIRQELSLSNKSGGIVGAEQ
jgi:cell division protein FtsX